MLQLVRRGRQTVKAALTLEDQSGWSQQFRQKRQEVERRD